MHLSPDSTDVKECLDMLIRGMSACMELYYSISYPSFEPEAFGYTIGKKYARVWRDNGTQRFVCFFVDVETGDVWKANGWKGPTLNFVRGNILSAVGRKALTYDKMTDGFYYYPAF